MSYQGQIANIPLGERALITDLPQSKIDPTSLIEAENVTIANGVLEKDPGSIQWNIPPLPSGIKQAIEWRPDAATRRVIVVAKDGKVYRFKNQFSFVEVTPTGGAPATLDVSGIVTMVPGGEEESNQPRKLFIFSEYNQVQVIDGDGTTRSNLSKPPADWTGNSQPIFGIIHQGSLYAFGNSNQKHRVYGSSATDHEDFTTSPFNIEVYPGEGERLISAVVFRGSLFFVKFPSGLYKLEQQGAATSSWFPTKLYSTFGGVSPTCIVPVVGDFLVANEYGSITSVAGTDQFGDVDHADVFHILNVQNYARSNISKQGATERHGIYYKDKKEALFTFRSLDATFQNRICRISYKDPGNPQVMWLLKDQPNCLFLLKDSLGIEKPAYGANDGYIYMMDSPNRWVGGIETNREEYEMKVQIPHFDLGFGDQSLSEQMKLFDFLEVVYLPTGRYNLYLDVFLDQKFSETKIVELSGKTSELGASKLNAIKFDQRVERSKRVRIHGTGRRISVRARMGTLGNALLVKLKVYYRLASQRQKE